MLPQENLKFSALKLPFSCVLRAPQAIQTHKQYLLQKGIILYKYSLLCLTIQGNIFCLDVNYACLCLRGLASELAFRATCIEDVLELCCLDCCLGCLWECK